MLAHGRWFSPDTPASSSTKTGRPEIAEKLLKVALNTINQLIKSLNNAQVGDFLGRIYLNELPIKGTTDTPKCAAYFAPYLEIDYDDRFRSKLNDDWDDFYFPIVNFPFICSNFPLATAYSFYKSQIICYSGACASNLDFLDKELILTHTPLWQGLLATRFESIFGPFYGHYIEFLDHHVYTPQIAHIYPSIWLHFRYHFLKVISLKPFYELWPLHWATGWVQHVKY